MQLRGDTCLHEQTLFEKPSSRFGVGCLFIQNSLVGLRGLQRMYRSACTVAQCRIQTVPPKGFEPLFSDRKIRSPRPLDEGGKTSLGFGKPSPGFDPAQRVFGL